MCHFPCQIHRTVTASHKRVTEVLQKAFFLHSYVLRCQAVNMEHDNRGKAGDYRIRRADVLGAIESLMALTSRSHGHCARKQNYVTAKYKIISAHISCRLFVTLR